MSIDKTIYQSLTSMSLEKKEQDSFVSEKDISDAKKELQEKSLTQIQEETAKKWAARAIASYQNLKETSNIDWELDAKEYEHEAIEHAALVDNSNPAKIVEKIHKAIKEYKNSSEENFFSEIEKSLFSENDLSKSEVATNETTNSLMNRVEDKYLVKRKHLGFLTIVLAEKLKEGDIDTEVRYNTNQSIYLDNKDLDAFKEALEEISPRLKIRVRRYAPNDNDWESIAYVEIKIKTNKGDTKKTRVRIKSSLIDSIASGKPIVMDEDLININKDLTRSTLEKRAILINKIVAKYGFKKQVVVTYKRRAYSNKKIRVTLDENVKYSDMQPISKDAEKVIEKSDNYKEWNKKYSKVREKDYVLVEVKHEDGIPDWMKMVLETVNAKKIGFSKYCAAIMDYLVENKSSGNISRDIKFDVNSAIDEIKDFNKSENLDKGALRNILTAGAMGTALASPSAVSADHPHAVNRAPSSIQHHSDYDSNKMLNAIAQVESSGGKNVNHKPTSQGTAYGRFALMPSVIHDTIRLNPDLKHKYKNALRLQGDHLTNFMHDNPNLEHEIASKHLKRLEHHFGQDPVKIGFAWNQGVVGTNKAIKQKHDISTHPYVQKIKEAYKGGEK